MSNFENMDNKKINELPGVFKEQLRAMYQGNGKYYTDAVTKMSDYIFNWLFALNTGGLALTITFMSAAIKWDSYLFKEIKLFISLIVIFSLGIISILIAVKLEYKRFSKKGNFLDQLWGDFGCGKKTLGEFLDEIVPKTPFLDKVCTVLEWVSVTLFFSGLILAVVAIVCKARENMEEILTLVPLIGSFG